MKMEVEVGMVWPQVQEAGIGTETLLRASGGSMALPAPSLGTSGLQNCG
jgi:hypothetical protein